MTLHTLHLSAVWGGDFDAHIELCNRDVLVHANPWLTRERERTGRVWERERENGTGGPELMCLEIRKVQSHSHSPLHEFNSCMSQVICS